MTPQPADKNKELYYYKEVMKALYIYNIRYVGTQSINQKIYYKLKKSNFLNLDSTSTFLLAVSLYSPGLALTGKESFFHDLFTYFSKYLLMFHTGLFKDWAVNSMQQHETGRRLRRDKFLA